VRSKCWGSSSQGQLGQGDTYKNGGHVNRGDEANEMGVQLSSLDMGAGWTTVEVNMDLS